MTTILFTILEIAFGFGGIFALGKGLASLRRASTNQSLDDRWPDFLATGLLCVGSAVALAVAVTLGGRGLGAFLMVLILPFVLILLAFGLAIRRGRPRTTQSPDPIEAFGIVVINQVVPGRVRGFDDGVPVTLTDEEDKALIGARGNVRLVAADASGHLATNFLSPILGFWNDEGTSVLLYPDDDVGVAVR